MKSWVMVGLSLAWATFAMGQEYQFTVDQASSGGNAQFDVSAATSGTLIGNYDAATNPAGTHTKPGLFGSIGATENVAVPVNHFDPDASGQLEFSPTGSFLASFDLGGGTMTLRNFSADLLGGGGASVPVSAGVSFSSFRTTSPSSIYPGVPLNVSLGNAQLSGLVASQAGEATGTLTPLGGNVYGFSITPMVTIQANVSFQGALLDTTSDPTALPLAGQITILPDSISLSETGPVNLSSSLSPDQPLDPLPYDLPAGADSAHIIFSLTLNTENTTVLGTQSLGATGFEVPEPGAVLLLASFGGPGLLLRRRRRRAA